MAAVTLECGTGTVSEATAAASVQARLPSDSRGDAAIWLRGICGNTGPATVRPWLLAWTKQRDQFPLVEKEWE